MLVLEGRIKDMIIRNGFNIYPQTFEGPLTEHFNAQAQMDLVRQTALVGVWNATKEDEDVILFVEWTGTRTKDASWLMEHALKICGQQALPDRCIGLNDFPITGRQNKLDKKALRALVEDEPSGSQQ